MPAVSERQRRYMAMCAHEGKSTKGCPTSMSKAQMRDFSYTSHMPKGASQSPKGDIGRHSDKEYFVQRHFKESGSILDSREAFGSNVGTPGHMGSADYGTKATHD